MSIISDIIQQKKKENIFKLPRIQKELTQCMQCGYCIDVCEAHEQTPWESVTPRGKIYYLKQLDVKGLGAMDALLGRKAVVDPYFVDAVYKCTGCGNCEAVCHCKIELVKLWEDLRAWLVENDYGPLPAHKKIAERIEADGNPYGEPKEKRDAWWPKEVKRVAVPDAVFFAGCTGSYRMQNIPEAGVRVLDRAGIKMNTLGSEELCCTSPAIRTGTRDLTLEAARTVVTKADAIGAKDMIMTCAGCYKTVSNDYGMYYSKTGQNVYHFTQYVEDLINERKLPLNNEFKAKVTYHDPCHLGRHAKVYDPPRNILKKIKGLEFVEMDRSRELSRCCGAGGGYKSAFNDFAVNVAGDRIRDAEDVGAEIIVTACPFCVLNLKAGAKKIGSKVKVMDISEVLLQVTAPAEAPAAKPAPETAAAKPAAPAAEAAKKADEAKIAAAAEEAKKAEAAKKAEEAKKAAAAEEAKKAEAAKKAEEAKAAEEAKKAAASDEEADESFEFELMDFEMTPEDIVRRAAWNKGLRCRRDYGPEKIPFAFVKGKVAVYVTDGARTSVHEKLEADDWKVLIFNAADVTDGEVEALAIKDAVKENLRDLKKKKKK